MDRHNNIEVSPFAKTVEGLLRIVIPMVVCLSMVAGAFVWIGSDLGDGLVVIDLYALALIAGVSFLIHYLWVSDRWKQKAKDAETARWQAVEHERRITQQKEGQLNLVQKESEQRLIEERRRIDDLWVVAQNLLDGRDGDDAARLLELLKAEQLPPEFRTVTAKQFQEFQWAQARAEEIKRLKDEAYKYERRIEELLLLRHNDRKHFDTLAELLRITVHTIWSENFDHGGNQRAGMLRKNIIRTIREVWGENSEHWRFVRDIGATSDCSSEKEEGQAPSKLN